MDRQRGHGSLYRAARACARVTEPRRLIKQYLRLSRSHPSTRCSWMRSSSTDGCPANYRSRLAAARGRVLSEMLPRCALRAALRRPPALLPIGRPTSFPRIPPPAVRPSYRTTQSAIFQRSNRSENLSPCWAAAPLLVVAAALAVRANDDDDEEEEEDDDEDEEEDFEIEYEDTPNEEPDFRERYMKLRDAKRWIRDYADNPTPHHIVEAFVPLVIDVQERVMDVASVNVKDFADFYFYAGFFASVLVDLPVDDHEAFDRDYVHCVALAINSLHDSFSQLTYLDRISDELSKFPERQQASRMVLIYTAMLTKEPKLVKWFKDNARARLNREPKYAGQPKMIAKQIGMLIRDLEQQLNENWSVVASGHFIATRSKALLHDLVESLDFMVQGSQGRVPRDAIEEVIVRCIDKKGVAVRTFARMDLSERSPDVRGTITAVVKAAGLKMRPPARRKQQYDE